MSFPAALHRSFDGSQGHASASPESIARRVLVQNPPACSAAEFAVIPDGQLANPWLRTLSSQAAVFLAARGTWRRSHVYPDAERDQGSEPGMPNHVLHGLR